MTRRPVLLALLGGILLAAATPPWGFWPLAFFGVVCLERATVDGTGIQRLGRAWIAWAALLFPSLWWMRALTLPGYVIACAAFAGFLATGTCIAPRGIGRYVAIPAGVVFAEYLRWHWPFGGVPLSNLATGQVNGILAPNLRLGGALFVVLLTMLGGMAIAAAIERDRRPAIGIAIAVLAITLVGVVAPQGSATGETLDVALVQGGGPQGTRAVDTEEGIVTERHLAASEPLEPGFDLVVWPEDVVDVTTLAGSPTEQALMALARRVDATFVVGVIEDDGAEHFRNWAIAYDPEGDEIARYEKVERVPFGEWVPFRDLLVSIVGEGVLPARDARIGQTPAILETPVGTLGVSISWEIFFGERSRDAANNGAEILVNPTNGSSFEGTQVQTQQVANSQMRAIENGRWVLQVAPTGFSAVVTPDGEVLQRTGVSERRILEATVGMRSGRTLYTRWGDALALVAAVALFAAGWTLEIRGRRTGSDLQQPGHRSVVDEADRHVAAEAPRLDGDPQRT